METTEQQDLITRREASELAGVHLNTVRLWEQSGRVTAVKASNGMVLIPRREIEDIIGQRHDSAQGDAERIASLEMEVKMLREEVHRERAERAILLSKMLEMAGRDGGTERGSGDEEVSRVPQQRTT